jgi:cyclic beta-1,2-glucan synthetase
MRKELLSTELTVFVPPDEPATVYLLTLRNGGDAPRRIAVTAYFQIVLSGQPEDSGPLVIRRRLRRAALFFENPRNTFRTGPAFAAMWPAAEQCETQRGRFLGKGRGIAHPFFAEYGRAGSGADDDQRPIAGLRRIVEVPPGGQATVAIVLGQTNDRRRAKTVVRKYRGIDQAWVDLEATRRWWFDLISVVRVRTADPMFDAYLPWLQYQTLAERIYARRGFYQASGAFGFRDQLQDAVNLVWMEPLLARRQILLHSAQQFLEGDVVHWFHLLQDGRTGLVGRSHASDNLLWLGWAVVEYLAATGDASVLDERTPYLEAERPLPPLPAGKEGMGFDPLRSSQTDSIYRHVMRAVDLVIHWRMGAHGLPLMGTGDWNDGLDAIGSQGRGESVWLAFFLYYILDRLLPVIRRRDGEQRYAYYRDRLHQLKAAIEATWRGDRYLRAIHDDGTEIGVAGSGIWEIDALTAAWAVMSEINPQRGRRVFETALRVLEREKAILLGWPPLREDSKPYLGRSSIYPVGVRENGMYCHGVQWLVGAARILADQCRRDSQPDAAQHYDATAWRLWYKTAAIGHTTPDEIEVYGGQPNQQPADLVTNFDPGRMIWNGYTGAAGWMFRQAIEGVLGAQLVNNQLVGPAEFPAPVPTLGVAQIDRDLSHSPLRKGAG